MKNKTIIGKEDNVNPANNAPQSAECSPNSDSIPTGIVFLVSSVMKIRGKKKSFQELIKLIIITVPKAGRINGNTTFHKILKSVAPSILAASSSPYGIVLKKPVNISIERGIPVAVYIKIRDQIELSNPNLFNKIDRKSVV